MTQDTERWTIWRARAGEQQYLDPPTPPPMIQHHYEPIEVVPASSLQEVEAEAARWKAELWQCYLMSGADPDGDDGSHLNPGETLYEVTELRKDYDECPTPERLQEVERERDRAVAAIQADHRHKASIGGSPCVCEWCLSNPEGGTDGRP